jgi:hypothetical protein
MPSQLNPFSTRFVRPGAIEYLFSDGRSAVGLTQRLRAGDWRGQIVGPHGSGKSTLLAALIEPLEQAGRRVWRIDLHDGQRALPPGALAEAGNVGADLLIVDGYDQLSRISRLRLKWQLWRRGWGAIVTAHREVGYPTLYRTSATVELTERIVARLLPTEDPSIAQQAIAASFYAAGGNVRETLFALYDHFERERRAERQGTSGLASSGPARREL